MVGASGAALCFDCRFQWEPGKVTGIASRAPVASVPEPESALQAWADEDTADEAQAYLDALKGAHVIVDGHDSAVFVAFPVDGLALVERADGTQSLVDFELLVPVDAPGAEPPPDADPVSEALAATIGACVMTVADVIVRAGLEKGWTVYDPNTRELVDNMVTLAVNTAAEMAGQTTDDNNEPETRATEQETNE